MKKILIVFPNQLFKNHRGFDYEPDEIMLIEDALFFKDRQYPLNFHIQKLILHRASMMSYQEFLKSMDYNITYLEWSKADLNKLFSSVADQKIILMDPCDWALNKRLKRLVNQHSLNVTWLDSQLFINTPEINQGYAKNKKRWLMADFYKFQRRRLDVLMDGDQPAGGKWSFDSENRKKIPIKQRSQIPPISFPGQNHYVQQSKEYVKTTFPDSFGKADCFYYPVNHDDAITWLDEFLQQRFQLFGSYEDALVPQQGWLYHSVLTPMLNSGLLTPMQVINAALDHAQDHHIPINSLEGFIRQIIGWREFMRATYEDSGVTMRNGNHWQHTHKMPLSFYTATTGITPIDDVIHRVLKTGYCHHIERLMVLGGFMFLCRINADEIYKWFMSLFIDAYDWVMVPNVYAMSQNADGGLITTKPYFSGSAYLKKMGYNNNGDWAGIWDGLYWAWIWENKNQLKTNPRWAMMCAMAEKMDKGKLNNHLQVAQKFLNQLHS